LTGKKRPKQILGLAQDYKPKTGIQCFAIGV